jgi:tetratricopeptide (TPR) repeat protein
VTDVVKNHLLNIGEIFSTHSGDYQIIALLGSGLTGEVYRARAGGGKDVAIKLMKPDASPLAKKAFISEATTLALMQQLEKNAADGLFVAPQYFGADENSAIPYIVQELIEGKKLVDTLVETPRLPEKEALLVGRQLFRTLNLLHTGLKLTYIDLKFENLWWNPETQTLKMTDWGTLSALDPNGVARDILRGSQYLYRLLTGQSINETRGIPLQSPQDFPEWKELSWGLQEILHRMLHRDPSVRYQTAADIANMLNNLSVFWQKQPQELLDFARNRLQRVEELTAEQDQEKKGQIYRSAMSVLDICGRLPGGNSPERMRLLERVNQGVEETNHFIRAKALFDGLSYPRARMLFEDGARLYYDSKLRRWALFSEAGEIEPKESFEPLRPDVESAIKMMEEGRFSIALDLLEKAVSRLPNPSLTALRDECLVFIHMHDGRTHQKAGSYLEAAAKYQTAFDIWSEIPKNATWQYLVGDLRQEAQKMQILQETRGTALAALENAKASSELSKIIENLEVALYSERGSSEIFKVVYQLAERQHRDGKSEAAAHILYTAYAAPDSRQYTPGWNVPAVILEAITSGPMALAGSALAQLPETPLLLKELVSTLLEKNIHAALSTDSVEHADAMYQVAAQLDSQWAANRFNSPIQNKKQELQARREAAIDRLIKEATSLLSLDNPEQILLAAQDIPLTHLVQKIIKHQSVLQRGEQALTAAASLSDNSQSRRSELNALIEKVAHLKILLVKRQEKQRQQADLLHKEAHAQVESALQHVGQIDDALQNLEETGVPGSYQEGILLHRQNLLTAALLACRRVLNEVDPQDSWAREHEQLIQDKISSLAHPSWVALVRLAQPDLQNAADMLQAAHTQLEVGQAQKAACILGRFEDEFIPLKKQTALALTVFQWEAENAHKLDSEAYQRDLLRRISLHLKLNLPTAYWKDSLSLKYLALLRQKLQEAFLLLGHPDSSPSSFITSLQRMVYVLSLHKQAEAAVSNHSLSFASDWNPLVFIKDTRQTLIAGPKNAKLASLFDTLPLLADSEQQAGQLSEGLLSKVQLEDRQEFQILQDRQSRRKRILLRTGLGTSFTMLVVFSLLVAFNWNAVLSFITGVTPTPTFTPTSSIEAPVLNPVNTREPSPTPILTETPTPAPEPTLEPEPTESLLPPAPEIPSLPPSSLLVSDLAALQPPIPGPAAAAYLLGEDNLTPSVPFSETPFWRRCSIWASLGQAPEVDSWVATQAGSAAWRMDVSLPPGRYQVYVLDTNYCSGGDLNFQLYLDDTPLEPLFGLSRLEFSRRRGEPQQTTDLWKSIGIYQFDLPGLLHVETTWQDRDMATSPVSLAHLLILEIPESDVNILDELGQHSPIFVVDDLAAEFSSSTSWVAVEDASALGGAFSYFSSESEEAFAIWRLPTKVDAGRYEVQVRMPVSHASADVFYDVLIDNQVVETYRDLTLNQSLWGREGLGSNPLTFRSSRFRQAGFFSSPNALSYRYYRRSSRRCRCLHQTSLIIIQDGIYDQSTARISESVN